MSHVKPTGEGKQTHPSLIKAAQMVAQARALHEEFKADPSQMPADVASQIDGLLTKSGDLRRAVEQERQINEMASYLTEPDYKHEGYGGGAGTGAPQMDTKSFQGAPSGQVDSPASRELKTRTFYKWVRKGMAAVPAEVKGDLVEDATGEILVPEDVMGPIFKELPRQGVLRGLSFIRPTTSDRIRVTNLTEGNVAWGKLETAAGPSLAEDGPADASPTPGEEYVNVQNLYALAKVGVDELEDSDENLESIIREIVALQVAEAEDDAFAGGLGDASKQPSGIKQGRAIANDLTAAAENTVDSTELKRLKYRVSAQFRRNGAYLAHSDAEEQAALLVDGNGNFLWQPNVAADEPARFAGKAWYTLDGLDAIPASADTNKDNVAVMFGDVRQAYVVADRRKLTVKRLSEKYAEEGKVGFLFTHRVGGAVIRPKAVAGYLL